MKAVIINRYGSPEVLEYADVAMPKIGPEQLLVKVHATSVNPVDWKIRQGDLQLLSGFGFPKIPGSDLSGVVVEVGADVTQFQPGDEVYTFLNPLSGGAYAEYAAVPASTTAHKPGTITHEEAAAVPLAGLTALQALLDLGQMRSGQRVLINGASGGVGSFAVQIARAMETEVTGVCSTANLDVVRSWGADVVLDYTQVDFTQQGTQYDIIFDAVGKQTFYNCEKVLQPDGIYVSTLPSLDNVGASVQSLFLPGKKAKLILAQPGRRDLEAMRDWIEAGKVRSHVHRSYSLSDVARAHGESETGHVVGKIVMTPGPGVAPTPTDIPIS
ncbi:NAD(P)-dependent alcohol dehydrogenase [Lyngbya sp. CCY1209]|uniref:NAD(P)-dependent alcohol dehydrogenase n=1 Tax=Lyngbya sp. CCY1209 TaxID=2886103 RepID=UPI002D1FD443|nr:NAD(P)-dependent alcohol dehydrogenase [Lyngbya sp. CCY1209]MEB3884115.1 NAD(P)-dependent alcohol dehydrogenase [Lyngbya sp. CCY1209]